MAKNEKTRDLTDLLIRRIRNYYIAEGVALNQLKAIKEIVAEYFKVLLEFIISGDYVKIGHNNNDLIIKSSLVNIEDVNVKKTKPILIPERIDKAIIIEFSGTYLINKNTKMFFTKRAMNEIFQKVNYKNIESA
jgi:hypothetical protein